MIALGYRVRGEGIVSGENKISRNVVSRLSCAGAIRISSSSGGYTGYMYDGMDHNLCTRKTSVSKRQSRHFQKYKNFTAAPATSP